MKTFQVPVWFNVQAETQEEAWREVWKKISDMDGDWTVNEPVEISEDNSYIVLYRREDIMAFADPPFSFQCWAEDTEHAEEQVLNAEPDADIVWVVQTENVQEAYNDYWDTPAGFTNDEEN